MIQTAHKQQDLNVMPPIQAQADAGDEQHLLQQVSKQDHQAFEILYQRYTPRLRGYVMRHAPQLDMVDEQLNDVMMVLWQQPTRIPPDAALAAWLYGIARNKLRRAFHQVAKTSSVEVPEETTHTTPEHDLLSREQKSCLTQCIDKLPPEQRETAKLWLYQGCSLQEIARQTHTNVNTVKSRILRVRHRLTDAWATHS